MPRLEKPLLIAVIAVLLITFTVSSSRGEGMIHIYYVETDRGVYEVGENVNITAAWHVYYDNSFQYSEAVIMCWRGLSSLASETWLNETEGYHVHQTRFLLNPNAWNPGQMEENGTAECTLSLLPEGGYVFQRLDFTVTRARQNCTLTKVIPTEPAANVSVISLLLRVYNRNNSSFGVGSNSIYFNVTNPYGLQIVTNSISISDPNGNFTVSFNPDFVYGTYLLSFKSVENGRYKEGRFNYVVNVDRSPIPTNMSIEWNYVGRICNSSASYVLEPVEITTKLTNPLNGTGIKDQQLNLRILDALTLQTVCRMEEPTNASGSATCTFRIPYEGGFILEVSYDGLNNAWSPSFRTLATLIKAKDRELSIVELSRLPPIVALNHSYVVKYLVIDALAKTPVQNSDVTVKMNGLLLAEGITNNDGVAEFNLCFPNDNPRFAGSATLIIEASYKLARGIYSNTNLTMPLLCKIQTTIKLRTSSQGALEAGETILVQSELLSSDLTPVSGQNVMFVIFTKEGTSPSSVTVRVTDSRGTCNISLKLESGTITIMARFDGNTTFNASNDTCSFSVLPVFQERLSSSIPTVASAYLFSVISLLAAERTRRKARWQDIPLN